MREGRGMGVSQKVGEVEMGGEDCGRKWEREEKEMFLWEEKGRKV